MTSKVVLKAAEDHFLELGDRLKPCNNPHSSFEVLRGQISKYAYHRLGKDWLDAEDAVQDAYVKVLETAKVNEFFNFGGLYKIWLDRAIGKIKTEKRRRGTVIAENEILDEKTGLTLIDMVEGDEPSAELLILTQKRVNIIMEESNRLKPKAKSIVRLFLIFGYSYKEISEMLHIEERRVNNTLTYFRGLLNG